MSEGAGWFNELNGSGIHDHNMIKCPCEADPDWATLDITAFESNEQHCAVIESIKVPPVANDTSNPGMMLFDEAVCQFMREQNIPGVNLAIGRAGQLIYCQGYGSAGRERLVHKDSRFRIASISKVLTSVAVLRLVQDKALSLSEKVFGPKGILKEYGPVVGGDRRINRITVHHLLQHSGGWDFDEIEDPMYYRHVGVAMGTEEPVTQDALIRYMMQQRLQFTPGSRHSYCNFGYMVLGRVIERVSGKTYEEHITGLLAPLGIASCQIGGTKRQQTSIDEVNYFTLSPDHYGESVFPLEGQVPTPYGAFHLPQGAPNGGWVATSEDLVKLFLELSRCLNRETKGELLGRDIARMMLKRPSYTKGTTWYGLGLEVFDKGLSWQHTGAMDGTVSVVTHDKSGFTWAILANCWSCDTDLDSMVKYAMTRVDAWCEGVLPGFSPQYGNMKHLGVTLDHCVVRCQVPINHMTDLCAEFSNKKLSIASVMSYTFKGSVYCNAVWTTGDKKQIVHFALNLSGLNHVLDTHKGTYCPMWLDSHIESSGVCYSVILEENLSASGSSCSEIPRGSFTTASEISELQHAKGDAGKSGTICMTNSTEISVYSSQNTVFEISGPGYSKSSSEKPESSCLKNNSEHPHSEWTVVCGVFSKDDAKTKINMLVEKGYTLNGLSVIKHREHAYEMLAWFTSQRLGNQLNGLIGKKSKQNHTGKKLPKRQKLEPLKHSWYVFDVTKEEYETAFSKHVRFGHTLVYAKGYTYGNDVMYSAVWGRSGSHLYASSLHLSKYGLWLDMVEYCQLGYSPVCISSYQQDDFEHFIAVWHKHL